MAFDITVKAVSRFDISGQAYHDLVKHGYNPNYVNPQTRRILLQSSILPSDTRSWEWRVTRRSDGFVLKDTFNLVFSLPKPKPSTGFNLPSEGIYDCQLIITRAGGKQEKSPVKSINLRDFLIVVIGDSAASGEGNPDEAGKLNLPGNSLIDPFVDFFSKFVVEHLTSLLAKGTVDPPKMDKPPRWLEKNAHRSLRAGHVRAAKRLEDLEAGIVITLLTFARSGATIKQGLLGPRKDEKRGNNDASWMTKNGKIGQLEELTKTVGKRPIDALIISIGGNDLGFASSVKDMVTGDSAWIIFDKDDSKARAKIKQNITQMLGADLTSGELTKAGGHFDQLKSQIDKLNVKKVFLAGYPIGFFDDNKKDSTGAFMLKSCEVLEAVPELDLDQEDMKLFRDTARLYNRTLQTVIAPRYGWDYIDVTTDFAGHGYCSKNRRFFIHCEESLEIQGDVDGMLHPNLDGHKVYEEKIHNALHKRLILQGSSNQVDLVTGDTVVTESRQGILAEFSHLFSDGQD